ncbi:nucleotide exchange factor GrpE [Aliamphritea spongicola]|uniref:nucleotide exchange factor GrpE n=1 Tax=Aliamphritea spongicola TaxID=707589 RepID=UPI00196A23F3|nr:nucleotide exchange factor GrpE [Aliamphritea spongicola]MBN3563999.1 nucleotide exchange factor GrpE [Aliamphritea spongicola]
MAGEDKVQADAAQQENPAGGAEDVLETVEGVLADEDELLDTAVEGDADITALQASVATLEAQVAALKDQELRTQADMQNVRRRAEMDVEKAHKFALEKFTNELLPVMDSLERAIEASQSDDEAVKALREGVEMTLNMFVSGLEKFKVEQVNPVGDAFNPELHQAMSMVPNPEVPANHVMAVMQKGYTLHGRLIRPAMVIVSQG